MINLCKFKEKKVMVSIFLRSRLIVFIFFCLLFLGDTLTSLGIEANFKFSYWFKVLLSLILVINLFFNDGKTFYLILVCFSFLLIERLFNQQINIVFKLSRFVEYYCGIMFFSFLWFNQKKNSLRMIYFFIFTVFLLTILIGAIFDVEILKTYKWNGRFGYKAFFSSQNEFSFVMIAAIIYFFNLMKTKKSYFYNILFSLTIFISFLVGTKVLYIFTFFVLLFLLFENLNLKKGGGVLLILIGSMFVFKSFIYKFINQHFESLVNVYNQKGFWNALSSLRIEYLSDRLMCHLNDFKLINYFFGGSQNNCLVEMSLFDLFFFFGIIGLLVYSFIFYNTILSKLKLDLFGQLSLLLVVLLSFIAGYYFEKFSAQIYIIGVIFIFYSSKPNPQNTKEVE